jgi:hypothetical protein
MKSLIIPNTGLLWRSIEPVCISRALSTSMHPATGNDGDGDYAQENNYCNLKGSGHGKDHSHLPLYPLHFMSVNTILPKLTQ